LGGFSWIGLKLDLILLCWLLVTDSSCLLLVTDLIPLILFGLIRIDSDNLRPLPFIDHENWTCDFENWNKTLKGFQPVHFVEQRKKYIVLNSFYPPKFLFVTDSSYLLLVTNLIPLILLEWDPVIRTDNDNLPPYHL